MDQRAHGICHRCNGSTSSRLAIMIFRYLLTILALPMRTVPFRSTLTVSLPVTNRSTFAFSLKNSNSCSSHVSHGTSHNLSNQHVSLGSRRSIHKKSGFNQVLQLTNLREMLPPEIWSLVCEILDPPDLFSLEKVRNSAPRFRASGCDC